MVVPDSTTCGAPSTVSRMSAMRPRLSTPSTDLDRRVDRAAEQERDGLRHGALCLAIGRRDELVRDRQVACRRVAHLEGRLPAGRASLHAHRHGTDTRYVDLVDDGACLEPGHPREVRHVSNLPSPTRLT